jgi:coenzyme F420-0:L-glutamate ligase/coenzyme F420-1:gamma-L-glutamate ligase
MSRVTIFGVHGIPEVGEGDDVAELIASRCSLEDGDVVVVTQKIVSKAEGRVVAIDPLDREGERLRIVAEESRRIVARRGPLIVAETAHGFVAANAGVDGSNLPADRLALLPLDPDGSAARIRAGLRDLAGVDVGVIVSDTFGRPWRMGQTNVAVGVAGLSPLRDHRGDKDAFGNVLEATLIAEADELASAAELVMGKTDAVPVAVVRGLGVSGDGSARELVRPAHEDLFRTGVIEGVEARRTVRSFDAARAVTTEVVERCVEAAVTAPAPHGSAPWRFVWLRSEAARRTFLGAMAERWRVDLVQDGVDEATIERRVARSYALLGDAPVLLACFVSLEAADSYADERRRVAERDMFVASAGAAIQNVMVALSAHGVGSCWISSSLFCPSDAAAALGLSGEWHAMGCVGAGYPSEPVAPRAPRSIDGFLDER